MPPASLQTEIVFLTYKSSRSSSVVTTGESLALYIMHSGFIYESLSSDVFTSYFRRWKDWFAVDRLSDNPCLCTTTNSS